MIQSKKDLKYYLSEDLKRFNNHKPNIKDWLLHNEIPMRLKNHAQENVNSQAEVTFV